MKSPISKKTTAGALGARYAQTTVPRKHLDVALWFFHGDLWLENPPCDIGFKDLKVPTFDIDFKGSWFSKTIGILFGLMSFKCSITPQDDHTQEKKYRPDIFQTLFNRGCIF